jgi:hypothetical protein
MIELYLCHRAIWRRTTGTNEYGEPVVEEKEIQVRWISKRRLVRDRQGQEVVSESLVYTTEPVQPGDTLVYAGREWPVISVLDATMLDGSILFREVAC